MNGWDEAMQQREDTAEYGWELIIAVALMGGIVVGLLFANIWNDGVITGWFAVERFLCVLAALVYGVVLGWMIYPRRPLAWVFEPGGLSSFIESFEKTDPDSLKFMRRSEGEPPTRD